MGFSINSVSIDDFYTVYSCPAKLFLKLQGVKLPYSGKIMRREVEPTIIGQEGERKIFNGVVGKIEAKVKEDKIKESEVLEHGEILDIRSIDNVKKILKNKDKISKDLDELHNQIYSLQANARSLSLKKRILKDDFIIDLKKRFNLSEIIPKVKFYNVSHHYEGEIDFLGITKTGDTRVIEVKNSKGLNLKRNKLQVSLYLDGMNKRYLANGSDLLTDINLHNIRNNLLHRVPIPNIQSSPKVDFWDYILINLIDDYPKLIHKQLQDVFFLELLWRLDTSFYIQLFHLNNLYGKTKQKKSLIEKEEEFIKFMEKQTKFLLINDLFLEQRRIIDELVELKDPIQEILDKVQNYLDQDPDSGLLVYTKREEKHEITEPIVDISELGKLIWDVKKRVFTGSNISVKNKEICNRCKYYIYCHEIEQTDEIDKKLKSSIVLVDQGIDNIYKKDSSDEISLDKAYLAYQKLKDNPKFLPKEISQWNEKEEVVRNTRSFRKYFLARRSRKFDKEISYWY